jgi:Aspartyl protease
MGLLHWLAIAGCTKKTLSVSIIMCIPAVQSWISAKDSGWESGESMQLQIKHELPFITVKVVYKGSAIDISDVLLDTGSATSIFSADNVSKIHLIPSTEDILYTIRGIGGTEVVFSRSVDFIQVGKNKLSNFQIEVGGMDYGFEISGILGMDFLTEAGAIINLKKLELYFSK